MDDGIVPRAPVQLDWYEHALADHDLVVAFASVGHDLGYTAIEELTTAEDHPHRLTVGVTTDMLDDVVLIGGPLGNATDAVAVTHIEMELTRTIAT